MGGSRAARRPRTGPPKCPILGQKWSKIVLPQNDTRPSGKVYGAYLGTVGLVVTRLAPLKARCLSFLEPVGPVLAARVQACPQNGQSWAQKLPKMISPQNVPRPFGKINGAHLGQFGPVLRVKGWSRAQAGVGEECRLADNNTITHRAHLQRCTTPGLSLICWLTCSFCHLHG